MEDIKVIDRRGNKQPLDISRIRLVVEWACAGKEVNPIELESSLTTRLREGVTTREIQNNLVNCALELSSLDEPDWRYVAGRLVLWGYYKDTIIARGYGYGKENYRKLVRDLQKKGLYSHQLNAYSNANLEEAASWINPDLDMDYDHAGISLLINRYLLKNELPQEAFLTVALLLASQEDIEGRLEWAKDFYLAIAQRKISLATPLLANLRKPRGSLTSCFITTIEDNLDSIFHEVTNVAKISKNGGGVGVNMSKIRASGSQVNGRKNASGGVVPFVKILNDTAVAINQGGLRAGACTVGIDIWHLDVLDFLEMQTENGDQRRKAYDIFPQIIVPDEFMRRVEADEDWLLIDPKEAREFLGFDLAEAWGDRFNQAYISIEQEFVKTNRFKVTNDFSLYKIVRAKELFKQIMKVQIESGLPYIAFKDTINEANPNKHDGYIPQTNLCVAPETLILTRFGWQPIKDVAKNTPFAYLWNGDMWSESHVFKTGTNQPLLQVKFSNGVKVDCTPYHKFWIIEDEVHIQKEARELKPGDKLIKCNLPLKTKDAKFETLIKQTQSAVYTYEKALNIKLELMTYGYDSYLQEDLTQVGVANWAKYYVVVEKDDEEYFYYGEYEWDSTVTIVSVEDNGRIDDTYCFTEFKRHMGMFNGVLLGNCTESFSNVTSSKYAHCCNLVSLNLANIERDDNLPSICDLAVRILDNSIELTIPPIAEAKAHNRRYRTIGVGAMGLADWLAKNGFTYKDTHEINQLFEDIAYECTYASTMLAEERGTFEAYSISEWSKGKLLGSKSLDEIITSSYLPQRWISLARLIEKFGIRNSQIMAIAPNTSSSILQGCTASILPTFSRFFYDKNGKGIQVIAPPFIKEYPWFYQENKTLDQKVVIDAVSAIQQWVDTGISMELLFNLNPGVYYEDPNKAITAREIFDTLIYAWKKKCKAIYYIRSIQLDSFELENKQECVSCAN